MTDRTIQRFTLEDLATELEMDIMETWHLLKKHHVSFQESEVSRGSFFYYLKPEQLHFLEVVSKQAETV